MYMMPYDFDDSASLLSNWLKEFDSGFSKSGTMATDVIEKENEIHIEMDLPGIEKNNINIELEDGYLTITASTNSSVEENKDNGNYIRRERKSGSYRRSFRVDKNLTSEQIKAKFENGTLTLTLPKIDKNLTAQKKTIAIEG